MPNLMQVIPRASTNNDAPILPISYAADDFNRADTTADDGLGTAPTGQTWSSNFWTIRNQQAYRANSNTTTIANLDLGQTFPQIVVSCRFVRTVTLGRGGVVARYIGANDYVALSFAGTAWNLIEVVSGTSNTLATIDQPFGTPTPVLVVTPTTLRGYLSGIDGADTGTLTNTTHAEAGTRVGFLGRPGSGASNTLTVDNFYATENEM